VGYEVAYLDYENRKRDRCQTSWSCLGLLRYSIDGFINFSEIPLNIATGIDIFCLMLSVILSIFYTIKILVWSDSVEGFPTLVILVLLLGGLQLLALRTIGNT
jgi:glucosyltransferase